MHPMFIFAGFFLFAIANNMLGPLATNIMASTGLSLSQSGSLISFLQLGSLIAIIGSLLVMKRLLQSTVIKIGYFLLVLALVAISFTTGSLLLFAMYAVIGFSAFLIDSGSNAVLSSDYYEKRGVYIPLLHFCYSTGAIITGFVILPFKGPLWRLAYGTVGLLVAIILLLAWREQRRKHKKGQGLAKEAPPKAQVGPIMPIVKDGAFIIYTLALMLYMGSQIICATWIPVYVETELFQPPTVTAMTLTVFWIGIAISRLIMAPIMSKGGDPFVLSIVGLSLAGCSLLALTFSANIVVVLSLVALCGFFAGTTIPLFIVITATWYPKNTAFISLSYILSGTIGKMIFPWLVTRIAEANNLGYALMLSSLMLFISAILTFVVQKMTKQRMV
ncbi:MFS transporter [Sphaerochaeta sp. PS]|uniref:MFS transporter n=1 Tax=Sphaerochaeta sp. PS TaxID=3076336 RepID=UPI0028A322B8|nr:MFS transporter [Sphaerochaeta sp. PS]MDT4761702.1 MFS transporter [Sphaerochaeta sp. PS]